MRLFLFISCRKLRHLQPPELYDGVPFSVAEPVGFQLQNRGLGIITQAMKNRVSKTMKWTLGVYIYIERERLIRVYGQFYVEIGDCLNRKSHTGS